MLFSGSDRDESSVSKSLREGFLDGAKAIPRQGTSRAELDRIALETVALRRRLGFPRVEMDRRRIVSEDWHH